MLDLTFGEQVKIVLSRKGMTIKELAEIIESKTGKKMSRQNLTQRLGRDNFQEQDMRMIAEILECPFQLNILNEDDSIESNYNNKEEAMVLKKRQKVADKKAVKETAAEVEVAVKKTEPEVLEEVTETAEAVAAAVAVEPEYEAVAEPEAVEPEPEAVAEPETAEPEFEAVAEVVAAEPEPEAVAEPETAEPEFEAVAEVVAAEPEPEAVAEPETAEPEFEAVAEAVAAEPEFEAVEEPAVTEPEPEAAVEPAVTEPEPEVAAEPAVVEPEAKKEEEKPKRGWFANFRRRGKEEKAVKEVQVEEEKENEKPAPVYEPEETYYAPENDMVQQAQTMDQFQDNGSYLNSLVQEASAQNNWYPQVEEAYREEVEAVETIPVDEEDLERGEINPYTGREYQTNSVRVHPKKIGYVQVYNRGIHAWEEMTEWAFLGYQEQKKAELGKAYEEPIYLD